MKAYIQAQIGEIYVGEETISQEDLERYALMFNYINRSTDLNKFTTKPTITREYSTFLQEIDNQGYLQTDFVADFNKEKLRAKASKSVAFEEFYNNFEISNVGIKLVNQDPITISKISKYLDKNKNLVNYLKLHKQGIDLNPIVNEDPIIDDLFMRNYYVNFPTAIPAFKGDYNKLSEGTMLAKTKAPFIRVSEGLYEIMSGVGSQGIYGKLKVQEGAFKSYDTTLSPPSLDIDISEISAIDANLNIETELKNLYSEEEKAKINNEQDNC